jgi:hypothetical protein
MGTKGTVHTRRISTAVAAELVLNPDVLKAAGYAASLNLVLLRWPSRRQLRQPSRSLQNQHQ